MSGKASSLEWDREALLQSPLFAPLHPVIAALKPGKFPALEELNAHVHQITVQSGHELRFVEQGTGRLAFEAQYEPRCYLSGEVQTRKDNWHDLLNALVWLTYPKSKAAINARHFAALTAVPETSSQRGAVRDTTTLLDESGVIVAYADDELAGLLQNFQWTELFWQRREQLQADPSTRLRTGPSTGLRTGPSTRLRTGMGFYLFGHGLYEKALKPYIGMTGQGLLLAVKQAFFSWSADSQRLHLDNRLADYLTNPLHCIRTRELSPVPLLGVPGWSMDNNCAAYYQNTTYFRPGRNK